MHGSLQVLHERVSTFNHALVEAEAFVEDKKLVMMAALDKNIRIVNDQLFGSHAALLPKDA